MFLCKFTRHLALIRLLAFSPFSGLTFKRVGRDNKDGPFPSGNKGQGEGRVRVKPLLLKDGKVEGREGKGGLWVV